MIKRSFNENWYFSIGGGNALSDSSKHGANQAGIVTVPHDASILRPRDPQAPGSSSSGFFQTENCWYRKEFDLDEADAGKNVWLEFDGIYHNSYIYINGAFAARQPYGYSRFFVDATKFVRFGEKNKIRVVVKNGVPSARWYTGGGIYRDVHIMIADRLHYRPEGIRLTTVQLEEDMAVVCVDSVVEYTGTDTRRIQLKIELLDEKGNIAAQNTLPVTVFEHSKNKYRQTLYVSAPKTWSDETPYLYTYRASILEGETVIDAEEGTFGIRKLTLDPKRGLRVNGRPVKLRGGCIHHDNGIIGSAEFAHAAQTRIRELKKAGYNAVRSAHNPMSPALLDACDRLGMYVMDEFSDVWVSAKVDFDYGTEMPNWWKADIHAMVDKDYNHPSVIMYSIGNEISEEGNPIDVQWGKLLADELKMLDPTRYTTLGINPLLCAMEQFITMMKQERQKREAENSMEINSAMNDHEAVANRFICSDTVTAVIEEALSQVDIIGYNYALSRYDVDHRRNPNSIIVGAETYPKDLDVNWEAVMKAPYVIGDFSWTAWDYLGEAGIGKIHYNQKRDGMFYAPYPTKAAYCADFDLIGVRRPTSYWREIIWGLRKAPYLCVQHPKHYGEEKLLTNWTMTDAIRSWNFSGYEGKNVVVEVYTDAQEAELFVNGNSVGKKKVGEQKKAQVLFDTVYVPGVLRVVTYNNGLESGSDEIITAGEAKRIMAQTDRNVIPADGSDICYVDISIADAHGAINPEANHAVTIQVEGAGSLLGYGSADPESEENYYDQVARAYEGRLRAAIRSNGNTGEICVKLSADGLEEAIVMIQSK
jgi:beta-galactosidase